MTWDKPDDETLTFECDTCSEVVDLNIDMIRETREDAKPGVSDFIVCWRYLQDAGWRSFKHTGRNWTYHCAKCGPEAEAQSGEHKRQERERDRLKARNAA